MWYCQKCLGFWVSIIVSGIMKINLVIDLFPIITNDIYKILINIIAIFINAALTTYLLYYIRAGIEINHVNIIVGDNKHG
jgi:hypothetical protein